MKWHLIGLLILVFGIGNFTKTAAQSATYLGIEQGLSNTAVTSVYKDSKGFMWFGTYDGLNKYDGSVFTVFRNKIGDSTSLAFNTVSNLAGDKNNNIWLGSSNSGLCIYHPISNNFSVPSYYPSGTKKTQKVHAYVYWILIDNNGFVFVATKENGVLVFEPGKEIGHQTAIASNNKKIFNYSANAIAISKANSDVWLFAEDIGLCKLNRGNNEFTIINNSIANVNCLKIDKQQTIWMGTSTGLSKYSIATNKATEINYPEQFRTSNLYIDRNENLWLSTSKGILCTDVNKAQLTPFVNAANQQLTNNTNITDIYEDEEGKKWVCTVRGGINIIKSQKNLFEPIVYTQSNLSNTTANIISTFCEDVNGIWIGTSGYGLRFWNRKTNTYTFYSNQNNNEQSLASNQVSSIVKDAYNTIWVSNWLGGINRFDRIKNTFTRYKCINPLTQREEKNVTFLYEDREKQLWASTGSNGTLYLFNRSTNQFDLFDKSIVNALCMAEDKQGNLWAGTYSALIKVDKRLKKHQFYNTSNSIRAIHEDKKGNFWLGTEGAGLLLFSKKDGSFKRYDESNGLQASSIVRIQEDAHGNLWMGTFSGLIKFDTQKQQFILFTKSDGLQSNQFSLNAAATLQSGEMLFGGIKGFNIFHPDSIVVTASKPNVFVTAIQIDGQPINSNHAFITKTDIDKITEITVPYDKAYFSIDFVAPEYNAPDKIKYSYQMKGWDKDYRKNLDSKTATYSHLSEGEYYFNIKITNVWGIWAGDTQLLKIIVLPPWYRTWWAYLIYLLAFVTAIYVYLRYKRNEEKLKYKVKLAEIQVKKEEELNERKLSFFTNIAHEFRTPLTLIINPLKDLRKNLGTKTATDDMNIVYRNARRLMSLVDQLLLFRKAENETADLNVQQVNFVVLCKEVFLCFVQQAASSNKTYEFTSEAEEMLVYVDPLKIEVCLFNLISNALKYTAENGKVLVHVSQTNEFVTVEVRDDGAGIPQEVKTNLFEKFYQVQGYGQKSKKGFGVGLYLVKMFVEQHKGRIDYTSERGAGTVFTIHLLKGISHFDTSSIVETSDDNVSFLDELVEEPEIVDQTIGETETADVITDKMLMLIIDDNREILEYVAKIFAKEFKVYEATNADEGLKTIKVIQPDVIISDIAMPGTSGIELCRAVKSDKGLKHIPFILLTASNDDATKLQGLESGADDYIIKPFEKDLLVARINGILKNRSNLQHYFFNEITLQTNTLKISPLDKEFIERCISIVEKNLENDDFNIQVFATEIGMSRSNLFKRVKAVSGQSVNSFIRFIRLRRAAELFINTQSNVNEVAFQVGINDIKYFREQFFKLFNVNPSDYIKRYRKALANSPFRLNEKDDA